MFSGIIGLIRTVTFFTLGTDWLIRFAFIIAAILAVICGVAAGYFLSFTALLIVTILSYTAYQLALRIIDTVYTPDVAWFYASLALCFSLCLNVSAWVTMVVTRFVSLSYLVNVNWAELFLR